jgi:hypothetical protein
MLCHKHEKLRSDIRTLSEDEFSAFVINVIENHMPCAVGKIGGTELMTMTAVEFKPCFVHKKACEQLCNWSGFFPVDEKRLPSFSDVMKASISNIDVLWNWHDEYEPYFINRYCRNLHGVIKENYVGAWGCRNLWTRALKGKRVLVIHPFEKSIQQQYQKRKLLFQNPDMLPDFELLTFKAVQSLGGICNQYADWFEALDDMTEKILQEDFDVALIGCGAYGLPLASRIKKHGKVAIHMGGDLQMLFGIMGKRWETNELAMKLYNEHWVYPAADEKPSTADAVEGGCYW